MNGLEVVVHLRPSNDSILVDIYLLKPLVEIVWVETQVWSVSDQINVEKLRFPNRKQPIIVSIVLTPQILYIRLQVVLIVSASVVD